jgi:hypothetical protein
MNHICTGCLNPIHPGDEYLRYFDSVMSSEATFPYEVHDNNACLSKSLGVMSCCFEGDEHKAYCDGCGENFTKRDEVENNIMFFRFHNHLLYTHDDKKCIEIAVNAQLYQARMVRAG